MATGPVTNFLLAIAFYVALAQAGAIEPLSIPDAPPPGNIAAQADPCARDRVIVTDTSGETPAPVHSWSDVRIRLYSAGIVGHDALVQVHGAGGAERTVRLHGSPSAARTPRVDVIDQIGLRLLGGPATIVDVLPSGATTRTGLRAGDQIIRFAGQPADQVMNLIRQIRTMSEWNTLTDILHNDQPMTLSVRPDADTDPGNPTGLKIGKLGTQLDQRVETATIRDESVAMLGHAIDEIWRISVLSLQILGKVIVGQASLQNLNGPVTVTDFMGKAASLGWQTFVSFLALISVGPGALNSLPVPVLDGGYLPYYCVEFLTGRPVPGSWQAIFQKTGVACILLPISPALYNDLNRLFLARDQVVFKLGR